VAKRALCFVTSDRNRKHVSCVSFSLTLHANLQCTSTRSMLYLLKVFGRPLKNFWRMCSTQPWTVTVLAPVMHVLSFPARSLSSWVWILVKAWIDDLGAFAKHRTKIRHTLHEDVIHFFLWWRDPQQMLQTHRSLEAYCLTLWWRLVFSVFPRNGAPVEWNWQGKPDTREKPVPMPLCPPQIPHGLTRDWTWASAVGGRRLTAWAVARPT
jgi:hypothetical protein